MASAGAALKKALLVAVCVMLLHSSMGQQPPTTSPLTPPASTSPYTGQQPPPPASPDCPYTGQQPSPPPTPVVPAPTPTPVPAPMPTPTPASPAPAPVSNCTYSDCASQCDPSCRANSTAGIAKCWSDHVDAFNACYDSCTSHTCPGQSCVHSGCGFGDCTCHNRNASSCCQWCDNTLSFDPQYNRCKSFWERYVGYCIMSCQDSCSKNCTQGA